MRSVHHLATATLLLALRAITSPIGDTTCACAHYQFLRFLSLVPYIYTPCQRPRTNQRWTKDEPKNSETEKSTFIKIAVSYSSLIPYLVLPRELRETTEGTPKEDHMTKKALFLRLSPKKVVLIPKKLTPILKRLILFLKPLTYLFFKKKSPQKAIFLAHLEKKCIFAGRIATTMIA